MVEGASPSDRFGLIGSTLAGRYYVDRQVAEGGFAVVYRAYQALLDRFVALKVLKTPPDLDLEDQLRFRERFAAEARTIARLKHPFIVSVHDVGIDQMATGEQALWMALEWLDGETLEADLDRRRGSGGRTVEETVQLLRPIVDAVAYAHRQGIVHRDIKPANMMLVPADPGRVLRMMDFGISKMMPGTHHGSTKHTGAGGSPGFSPHYASPEQVTFSRTGPWTDVHALGLVMTEMLTDEPPFVEVESTHLFEQVMAPERPTPSSKGKRVGPLEKVLARAVALSPRRRWQDAGELLMAIDSVLLRGATEVLPRPKRAARAPSIRLRSLALRWRPLDDRVVGRIVASVGSAIVLAALAILMWTLRSDRAGLSVGKEFANAARPRTTPSSGRVVSTPWIVPLPTSLSPRASAPRPTEIPAVERRPHVAAERPRRASEIADVGPVEEAPDTRKETTMDLAPHGAQPSAWTDPFGDGQTESRACRISINSIPWAEVWIDGRNTTKHTPLVDYRVGCGRHQIEFKRLDLQIDQIETSVVEPEHPFKRRYTLVGGVR